MMENNPTQRGFGRFEFTDQYGVQCSVQKSSLATEDCIWLGCNDIGLKHFQAGKGWEDVPTPFSYTDHWLANTSMHLTQDMVRDLLPILQHFADTGELPPPSRQKEQPDV